VKNQVEIAHTQNSKIQCDTANLYPPKRKIGFLKIKGILVVLY